MDIFIKLAPEDVVIIEHLTYVIGNIITWVFVVAYAVCVIYYLVNNADSSFSLVNKHVYRHYDSYI